MPTARRPVRAAPAPLARRVALASLAAVLALAAACGGPRSVSLADLAFDMERYDGDEVTTTGVVIGFDEDDGALEPHWVIQDADQNRVRLLPDEVAQQYVGSTVTVTGEFEFDPNRGRLLHVDTIEPAG